MNRFNDYVGRDDEMLGSDDALALLGVGMAGGVGGNMVGYRTPYRGWVGDAAGCPMPGNGCPPGYPPGGMVPNPYLPGCDPAYESARDMQQSRLARAQFLPSILLGVDSRPQTGAADILAGATLSITTEPSVPCCITKFTVSAASSPFFNINGIIVARVNLLAGGQGVPAEAFNPNANTSPIENPVLPAGSQVVTQVENVDAAAHRFRAVYSVLDRTQAGTRCI